MDPDAESVALLVDGAEWVVRVLGRARGGGATPLLLLGFWPGPDAEGGHDREVLVPARTLASLSDEALREQWRAGRAPPEPVRPRAREGRGGRRDGG